MALRVPTAALTVRPWHTRRLFFQFSKRLFMFGDDAPRPSLAHKFLNTLEARKKLLRECVPAAAHGLDILR